MLLIHGAHIADAPQPLVTEPALQRFQRIRYHQRASVSRPRPCGHITAARLAASYRSTATASTLSVLKETADAFTAPRPLTDT